MNRAAFTIRNHRNKDNDKNILLRSNETPTSAAGNAGVSCHAFSHLATPPPHLRAAPRLAAEGSS